MYSRSQDTFLADISNSISFQLSHYFVTRFSMYFFIKELKLIGMLLYNILTFRNRPVVNCTTGQSIVLVTCKKIFKHVKDLRRHV